MFELPVIPCNNILAKLTLEFKTLSAGFLCEINYSQDFSVSVFLCNNLRRTLITVYDLTSIDETCAIQAPDIVFIWTDIGITMQELSRILRYLAVWSDDNLQIKGYENFYDLHNFLNKHE